MNSVRGETSVVIDDQTLTLCLTLGALAEIETLLGCKNLDELQLRFKRLSSAEILAILTSLLRAGGASKEHLNEAFLSRLGPAVASQAIADAFHAALV